VTDTHIHAPVIAETGPRGDLCIRTQAMPADTNQNGDIFGGWLLSQMDVGGGVFASKAAKSRVVTVAIEAMNFRKAVYVGDLVSVHANLVVSAEPRSPSISKPGCCAARKCSRSWSPTATSLTSRSTIRDARRRSRETVRRSRPEFV